MIYVQTIAWFFALVHALAESPPQQPLSCVPPPPVVLDRMEGWHYAEHVTQTMGEVAKDVLDSPLVYGDTVEYTFDGHQFLARVEPHFGTRGRWHRGVSVYEPGDPPHVSRSHRSKP